MLNKYLNRLLDSYSYSLRNISSYELWSKLPDQTRQQLRDFDSSPKINVNFALYCVGEHIIRKQAKND